MQSTLMGVTVLYKTVNETEIWVNKFSCNQLTDVIFADKDVCKLFPMLPVTALQAIRSWHVNC